MVEIVAKVYRGEREESVHYGSVAVVDKNGRLTHYVGDPEFFTFVRSSAKPFQLIPLLQTGAADHFKFTNKQLAIMCGSHSGTDHHKAVVAANLAAAGNSAENLKCGTHVPIYMQAAGAIPYHEEHKDPLRHNCSGKHSGFLALARYLGEDIEKYLDFDSRTQTLVLEAASKMYEIPKVEIKLGVDGCSAPNFGLPLLNTAVAFKKLANGEGGDPEISRILNRIKQAMTEFPEMFSGEGRFDLAIMRSFPGNVVSKGGAEAIQGIGFADPPIGIAVKINDGNERAIPTVTIEVLRQLGLIDVEKAEYFKPFYNPQIYNWRKIATGRIKAEFTLKKA
ncbi:Asparaginase [Candidatus Zixiibacteriota bacterium]|nr:Asparaginase [candidate division Zixibacteria bacterium]